MFVDFYERIVSQKFIELVFQDSKSNLRTFTDNITVVVRFMLKDRFEQQKPTKKVRVSKRNMPHSADLEMLKEMSHIPTTKSRTRKRPIQQANPLHIIKAFKLLEYQIISGIKPGSAEWGDLILGQYLENMVVASNSLSALLISVRSQGKREAERSLIHLMSLVCIYRSFKVKAIASDSTITAEYSGDSPLQEVMDEHFTDEKIDKFLSKIIDRSKLGNFDELFIYSGNASSPNGGHSSINYLADVAAVMKDQKLKDSIFGLIEHFKFGSELRKIIDILMVNIDTEYTKDKIHSRLVTFTAPGGKSRIIAVVDWLSQTALSAIHKTQFRLLELIPSDRTFDHKSGLNLFDPKADCYHSVDLSAATDRLPRALQKKMIERIFHKLGMNGASIAQFWESIVDRSYSTKNSLLEKVAPELRYEVGQGMGLFSSWSSMALVHHYIVHELSGCSFENYVLVGDDLLMKNSNEEYIRYFGIMSSIGVRINPSKTLISMDQPHSLEFARNFIIQGHKIQPIPTGSVFAYLDNKIGSMEAFCAFLPIMRHISLVNLIEFLKIKESLLLIDIAYFLIRESVTTYNNVSALLKVFKTNLIISEEHIRNIIKIVSDRYSAPIRLGMNKLTQTLQSQCTITKDSDMDKLSSLALDFSVLKFAGAEIEDYSQTMFDRINDARLIEYDHDHSISTVSKREHRLIKDLLITLETENKNIRAGIKRIK